MIEILLLILSLCYSLTPPPLPSPSLLLSPAWFQSVTLSSIQCRSFCSGTPLHVRTQVCSHGRSGGGGGQPTSQFSN